VVVAEYPATLVREEKRRYAQRLAMNSNYTRPDAIGEAIELQDDPWSLLSQRPSDRCAARAVMPPATGRERRASAKYRRKSAVYLTFWQVIVLQRTARGDR
jgi:hypothetical protein